MTEYFPLKKINSKAKRWAFGHKLHTAWGRKKQFSQAVGLGDCQILLLPAFTILEHFLNFM